jgi:hypothetical protein
MPALDHAHHNAPTDAHAHHGEGAGDVAEVTDALAEHHSADAKHKKLSHSSCSACSAFCIGAVAPPSSSLPMPAFDGSQAVLIAPSDLITGFIPDGLQRPPRQ